MTIPTLPLGILSRAHRYTALLLLVSAAAAQAALIWKPLWDGKTLNGWHNRGKDAWTIEPDAPGAAPALHGKHVSSSDDYSMLYTDSAFDHFTLRVSYKMITGNSGVYVKAKELDKTPFVAGIQVDLDAVNMLALYCTSCGAGVYSPSAAIKARIDRNGWNVLTVTAKGDSLYTSINGADMPAWNYKGIAFVLPSGPFGLQLHDARLDEAWFRDIAILEGCTDKASPRYDKESADPRTVVRSNPAACGPSVGLAPGPESAPRGVRFLRGRVEIEVEGAYRLTLRDLSGALVAERRGYGPGSFTLPEVRTAGAYIAGLETGDGAAAHWKVMLAH
jgi:hypothetical protein